VIVMKFGGTSLADAPQLRSAVEIVRSRTARRPVVVVSAQGGVTDRLIELAQVAVNGAADPSDLTGRFAQLLLDLGLPGDLLAEEIDEVRALLQGIALVGDLTPRSLDRMMSFGERCSSRVVAATLTAAGLPARAAMSYDLGLLTDSNYGAARVLEESYAALGESLGAILGEGLIPVVTGFVAKDAHGFITTIGRSGSDYTAAIVGRALGAEEIEIWTDVDGVMSADPRLVEGARSLDTMSFSEAAELAYYGAQVIHPATIQPAVKANIPIRVLNTYEPQSRGTVILRDSKADRPGARSIASKARITLVHVTSLRMLLQPGFMAKLFTVFERHEVVIDMISTSEVSVTLTTDEGGNLAAAVADLEEFAEIRVERDKAILCLVGAGLRDAPDLLARVFQTLCRAGIQARMVSVGASEINVSLLVDLSDEAAAVCALHAEFFDS
jgi:aspartate kinase